MFSNSRRARDSQLNWGLALLLLVAIAILSGGLAGLAAAEDGDREPAYYTERYWQAAAAREARLSAEAELYGSYTDRYWQAAAAREARYAAQEAEDDYAYYTERYWQAAAAREAATTAR